jgi:hypothetical protein
MANGTIRMQLFSTIGGGCGRVRKFFRTPGVVGHSSTARGTVKMRQNPVNCGDWPSQDDDHIVAADLGCEGSSISCCSINQNQPATWKWRAPCPPCAALAASRRQHPRVAITPSQTRQLPQVDVRPAASRCRLTARPLRVLRLACLTRPGRLGR